ncbi:hypothetical protein AB0I28_12780 [Phytomonospora sp. NPDC050363]|uniref:hypothetical protein n=1 Tax=Phytomonospora sp. NPDC050363 TaxID=3155642 RepID=UPI0033ECD726
MERHIGSFQVEGVEYTVTHTGYSYRAQRALGDFATYSTRTRSGEPLLITTSLTGRGADNQPVAYSDPAEWAASREHRRQVGAALVEIAEKDRH